MSASENRGKPTRLDAPVAEFAPARTRDFDGGRWGRLRVSDPHGHGLDFVAANSGHYATLVHVRDAFLVKIRGLRVPSSFTPGYYVNIGTMRFGLRYRVARHLVREKKMGIWHVDRLTTAAAATPIGVVMVPWAPWTEHTLNRAVGERLGLSAPIPGFSSADCREDCQAHLWFSAQGITLTALAFAVGGVCATLVHPSTG